MAPAVADEDLSRGVAITSSIHPSSDTHVEPVRYRKGSNFMGGLLTLLPDRRSSPKTPAWLLFLRSALRRPVDFGRTLWLRRWSARTRR